MSEELQSLVQIIELYGRGLEGLGKAIRFSAKGAEKGVQIARVKALQHRMKLHYASEGTQYYEVIRSGENDRRSLHHLKHSLGG